MTSAERTAAERLIAALDKSLSEQAELWKKLKVENGYELLYQRRPTDRDIEMEIRLRMKNDYPEIIRWRLSFLLGRPMEHE